MDIKAYLEYLEQANSKKEKKKLMIEYATRLYENNVPIIWNIKHLSILLNIDYDIIRRYILSSNSYYKQINIPKKNGGVRELDIPTLELKKIQRFILDFILDKIKTSDYAFAFKKNCSIVHNAEKHVNKNLILNLDLKDFFKSIRYEQVFKIFFYKGYTKEVSYALASLVTHNGVLPQGAPTSPYLSNIVCLRLDKRLSHLASKIHCEYTRYADDITFSGDYHLYNYIDFIKNIIIDEGFIINEKKTRTQSEHYRQEVTGVIVNKKLKVNSNLKQYLRKTIYYIKKFGIDNHLEYIGCNLSGYKEHLYGIAYFIKMVEPTNGKNWIKELDTINWFF
jgi:hypothetical protein